MPSQARRLLAEAADLATQATWSARVIWAAVVMAALMSVWLLSTEPWGLGAYQLIVFMAPGALLGLGAGWMANGSTRTEWNWRAASRSAALGAVILPPVLAFVVLVEGNARPQRLLVGFVYAAWLALASGAAVALARWRRRRP
jgi:hypothetical protein